MSLLRCLWFLTPRVEQGVSSANPTVRPANPDAYTAGMRTQKVFRRVHYWGAAIAGIPLVVIICAGVLLQLKKQLAWVQPTEHRGSSGAPGLTFDQLLAIARSVPAAEVTTWDDIPRIEGRPQKGLIKLDLDQQPRNPDRSRQRHAVGRRSSA